MAENAKQLQDKMQAKMQPGLMSTIVKEALKQIPADLLDLETQQKFAKYISMDSFADITFGQESTFEPFAQEMAVILESRREKISNLKDLDVQHAASISQPSIALSFNEKDTFPRIMQRWVDAISTAHTESILDLSTLELSKLTEQYNSYLNDIAEQCDQKNLWGHTADSANIFQPFDIGTGAARDGHAFINQYKESTVLRRLFSIEPLTLSSSPFAAFEKPISNYSNKNRDSVWQKLETLFVAGQEIITHLKTIKQIKEIGFEEDNKEVLNSLKQRLVTFQKSLSEVQNLKSLGTSIKPNEESSFFYPIDNSKLNLMTGAQLATICLEEMNNPTPSPLIIRILKNDIAWSKMIREFDSGAFNARTDKPLEKIARIHKWHQFLQHSDVTTADGIKELEDAERSLTESKQTETTSPPIPTPKSYQFGDGTRYLLGMFSNTTQTTPQPEQNKNQSTYQLGDITKGVLNRFGYFTSGSKSNESTLSQQEQPKL